MSRAFKCDRCESYADGEPTQEVTRKINMQLGAANKTTVEGYELCDKCIMAFIEWLGIDPGNEAES